MSYLFLSSNGEDSFNKLIPIRSSLRSSEPQVYSFLTESQGNHINSFFFILALKVILLDRLQGINCSVIQEP